MRHQALLLMVTLVACQDSTAPNGPPNPLRGLPRALTAAEQDALAGSTRFGLDLFRVVARQRPGENVILSPLSASFALGMALNGAAGATRDSMRVALGWGSRSDQEVNDAYLGLATLLGSLDPQVQFTNANSIWIDKGFPVLASFARVNAQYFAAVSLNLDFRAPAAVTTINQWVSDATQTRIPKIIDSIDPAEVMFLINAIWFKGSWREQFSAARTQNGSFRNDNGSMVQVPMMHRHGLARLVYGPGYSGGEQSYGNGAYSMLILMPSGGITLAQLADSMTSATWTLATRDTSYGVLDVAMPRFRLADSESLRSALTTLGMGIAFSKDADFTRMTQVPVAITNVQQKTWIDVNEEGTEAAAVTSVGFGVTSGLTASLTVDRAFVFAIRERFSGAILFIGTVAKLP